MRPSAQTTNLLALMVSGESKVFMTDMYVMQRANGDVFAFDDHGRSRVPLFNSSSDAFLARLRNFGMLLFEPVQLDAGLLKQLVPVGSAAEVDFWLVNDPLINLNRGRLVRPEQLAAAWEDEEGRHSKEFPAKSTTAQKRSLAGDALPVQPIRN